MRLPLRQLRAIFSKGRGAVRRVGMVSKQLRRGVKTVRRSVLPTKKEHALSELRHGLRVTKGQLGIDTRRLSVSGWDIGSTIRRAPLSVESRGNRQTVADIFRAERSDQTPKAFNKIVKLRGRESVRKDLKMNRIIAGGAVAYGALAGSGVVYSHKKGVEHGKKGKFSYVGSALGGNVYDVGYQRGKQLRQARLRKVRRSKRSK